MPNERGRDSAYWVAVAALIGALGSIAVSVIQTEAANKRSLGSLEEGQKLCHVDWPYHFADGLVVPKSWSINVCLDYAKLGGATEYAIGCVFADGIVLSPNVVLGAVPQTPTRNCGW
ncbi:MAG TPA: hypothetical protein VGH98_16700 [Gemmatimonadaceae bacterium]|jgi:hypothetical protein